MAHRLIGIEYSFLISIALLINPTHASASCGERCSEDLEICEAQPDGYESIEEYMKEKRDAFEEKWRHERERKCGELQGQFLESCNRRLDQEREIDERRQILRHELSKR
jgi:hypothetical protein